MSETNISEKIEPLYDAYKQITKSMTFNPIKDLKPNSTH